MQTTLVLRVLDFVRLVILGRLLGPRDFGLLGIGLLTMAILNQLTETGFKSAMIQKSSITDDHLNVAWTVGIVRGILLYIVLYISAPLVAMFFQKSEATTLIRVIGIMMILNTFSNIRLVVFQKDLQFHKVFIYQIGGLIVDLGLSVYLAVLYKNVWALVWGKLAGETARVILSYLLDGNRPRFCTDVAKLRDLWTYGKWIFGTSILKFFIMNGDDFLVGRMLGVKALGLYRYAYRISNLVATDIGDVISKVSFSTYSKLQDAREKLRNGYIKSTLFVSAISYPITGGIIVLGEELIQVILGEKWTEMVPTMQILCLLGASKCMQFGNIFMSMNRPDISTKLSLVRLILIIITIYPLTVAMGMPGTALSVLLSSLLIGVVGLFLVQKFIDHSPWDFVTLVFTPTAATLVMVSCLYLVKRQFGSVNLPGLLILIGVGMVSYVGTILLFGFIDKKNNVFRLFKEIFKGLR